MTLALAVEDGCGAVLLAADSSVTRGHLADSLRGGKILRVGRVGLAFAGSVGAFQIATAGLRARRQKAEEGVEAYLRRVVVTPVREALSTAGLLPRATNGDEAPIAMVLAFAGRAYTVDESFALYSTPRGYATAGVAEDIARGVLEHTAGMPARSRVEAAYRAAVALSTQVRPPVTIEVVR